MIRVDRSELTRKEIIRVAANRFLNEGYAKTTVNSMAKALNMSTGNLTFHFPTKEHLLAVLVDMLCDFQWKLMAYEAQEGHSSMEAICLELMAMASAGEKDPVAKEFLLAAYTSPLCMEIIRRNDQQRAREVFEKYCPDWTEEQFTEAEMLVSGIEYATLMTTEPSIPLEHRLRCALNAILAIYRVPEPIRQQKLGKVLAMDYESLGARIFREFRIFVNYETEQAILTLVAKRKLAE